MENKKYNEEQGTSESDILRGCCQKNKLLHFTGIAHLLLFQSNLILPN